MNVDIRVHVVKYKNRKNLVMRYVDPLTGKQVSRTARRARKRDAERLAAMWEAELRDGSYQKPSRTTWQEFRQRYESEKLAQLSERSLESAGAAFRHLERVLNPKLLESLNSEQLSRLQRLLSDQGMRATTLASHLRSIRAALNWAVRQDLMREAPRIDMPKAARGINRSMRGRPITGKEFDRMVAAVPLVRKHEPEKWQRLLHGLWLSGLRLGEALTLSWDADSAVSLQLGGKYPQLRFLAEGHKSHRDELLPLTPDFAEFLLATPENERRGLVFDICGKVPGKPIDTKRASRYVSKFGKRAGIVVEASEDKFGTAHDLRRAFGTRWSRKVMPATLMKVMRHASVDTTMKFYVQHSVDDLAAELWGLEGSSSGGR